MSATRCTLPDGQPSGIGDGHERPDAIREASADGGGEAGELHADRARYGARLRADGGFLASSARASHLVGERSPDPHRPIRQPGRLRLGQKLALGESVAVKFVPPRTNACDDCPFWKNRPLHHSLAPGRLDDITKDIERGGYFPCHKTTGPRHALELEHDGWDKVPTIDKLAVVQKEQVCFGARNWAKTGGYLEDGIDPEA